MSGSRLYGTHTSTSDVDKKYLVLPEINDLLILKNIKSVFKSTGNSNSQNTKDDIDQEYIPLQVFARHFFEGQTYAIELAFAIDSTHAAQRVFEPSKLAKYFGFQMTEAQLAQRGRWEVAVRDLAFEETDYCNPMVVQFIHELRTTFLTSNIKAMTGYVVNQANIYSMKGERLNVLRAVRNIFMDMVSVVDNSQISLTNLWATHKGFELAMTELAREYPKYFQIATYDVGDGNMQPTFIVLERYLPFTNSLQYSYDAVLGWVKKYGDRANAASVDNVDWKAMMHAVRICNMGIAILEHHQLHLPFNQNYVDELLQIKRGEVPLENVKQQISNLLDRLKDLQETTTLPKHTPELEADFEKWLAGWMRKFYFIN